MIKRGADGVLLCHGGQVSTHTAPVIQVSDTVGAGDIWNAAYLHALSHAENTQAAAEFAVQVASTAVATCPKRYLSYGLRLNRFAKTMEIRAGGRGSSWASVHDESEKEGNGFRAWRWQTGDFPV